MMNISIPGYSETSPIHYNIQVSFERTTFNVKKRYSDFVEFVVSIENEMGEKAPVDLPAKKWIGSKSREFLDDRRRGLELFLRAIVKRDEWRDSLALMSFLEISAHIKNETSQAAKARGDWIKLTSEANSLVQQISKQTSSAERRRLSVLANARIKDLERILSADNALGDGEYRRRRDIIQKLNQSLRESVSSPNPQPTPATYSNSSTPSRSSSPRVLGGETERTRQVNNAGLMTIQKNDMEEQDKVIDNLREMISRQRTLGLSINEELAHHNQLLDEMDTDTHSVNAHLNQAKRRTGKLL
jgi:regulator of vacuolar morphogenesis